MNVKIRFNKRYQLDRVTARKSSDRITVRESGRYAFHSVQVLPGGKMACATNGYAVARIPLIDPAGLVLGVGIEKATWRSAINQANTSIAILDVDIEADTVTSCSISKIVHGRYPSLDSVIPEQDDSLRVITIDTVQLRQLAEALGCDSVQLQIPTQKGSALRVKPNNNDDNGAVGAIVQCSPGMP